MLHMTCARPKSAASRRPRRKLPDAKMTQEAVDFKERLARLLAAVLATCRFTGSQDSYSANEIRTLYNSDRRRLPDELWARITSTTADRFFDLLKDELATAGVEWENARFNPTLLSPYFGTTEPMGLLQSILRGGAILGPEKATDIVYGWLHGGRLFHEKVCRCGGRVPIREVCRARSTTATTRADLGVSGTLGTCGASNASNETRRS